MTVAKTLLASLCMHSLVIYAAAALSGAYVAGREQVFVVEIRDWFEHDNSFDAKPPASQKQKESRPETERPKSAVTRPASDNRIEETNAIKTEPIKEQIKSPEKEDRMTGESVFTGLSVFTEKAAASTKNAAAGSPLHDLGMQHPKTEGLAVESLNSSAVKDNNQDISNRIKTAIENALAYPPLARKRRIEGVVIVSFRIDESGMPLDIKVVVSSKYSILDEEAVRTVMKAAPLPRMNKLIEIPVRFRLSNQQSE